MTNQVPNPISKVRGQAFDVINGERDYQDQHYHSSPVPTLVDFTNLLIEYTDKLAVSVQNDPSGVSPAGGPLKRLREIAAIAVHAMEAHGVRPRAGHVPASVGITGTVNIVGKPDSTAKKQPAPAQTQAPTAASTAADAAKATKEANEKTAVAANEAAKAAKATTASTTSPASHRTAPPPPAQHAAAPATPHVTPAAAASAEHKPVPVAEHTTQHGGEKK